jgi:hypothetical protein
VEYLVRAVTGLAMDAETLDAEYYREQAILCQKLADLAKAAKPISVRLRLLAQAYEKKAGAVGSK